MDYEKDPINAVNVRVERYITCPRCSLFDHERQEDCLYCGGCEEVQIFGTESLNFDEVSANLAESSATIFSLAEADRSIDDWEVILKSEIKNSIKVIEAAANALVFLNGENDEYKSKILISDSSLPKRSRTLDQVINKINSNSADGV